MSENEVRDLRERLTRVEEYLTAPGGVLPQLASMRSLLEGQAARLERGDAAFDGVRTSVAALESGPNRAVRAPECDRVHGSTAAWARAIVPALIAAGIGLGTGLLMKAF